MALMALGHARHFLSDALDFSPTNLSKASAALFLTRWITHFCAPGFVFLAGVGVFLYSRKRRRIEVSRFLLLRGLWLVLLELTVVRCLGWNFNFNYSHVLAGVLWAVGWSMCLLAGLIHLGRRAPLVFGALVMLTHNAFDAVKPRAFGGFGWLWTILHRTSQLEPFDGVRLKIGYPLLPWVAILSLGYALGPALELPTARRRTVLCRLGLGATFGFLALRTLNIYGDPRPWTSQASGLYTLFSFLNTDKYPPSLSFTLMTLGPLLLLLALLDRLQGAWSRPFVVLGRVPLFYYLLHIPLIHLLAVALAYSRYGRADFLFRNPPALHGPPFPLPEGYGYSLPFVYLAWVAAVAILLRPCQLFGELKRKRGSSWLTYVL
jgi:uncharacterized membrane protein